MNIFDNREEVMYVQGNVMRHLLKIDDLATFQSVIGAVFDEWCARRGMSSEETCKALNTLTEVQRAVHEMEGPFSVQFTSFQFHIYF